MFRRKKTSGKENQHEFAVIGLGRFGASLARRLETLGHPVLGIDIDPRAIQIAALSLLLTLVGCECGDGNDAKTDVDGGTDGG